jgi:hypothetical protein
MRKIEKAEEALMDQNNGSTARASLNGEARAVHREIPQIDVSMHLPDYPGSRFPRYGLRLSVPETERKDSPHRPVDFLFHARTPEESLRTTSQLRSIKCTPEGLRHMPRADLHPVQILSPGQTLRGHPYYRIVFLAKSCMDLIPNLQKPFHQVFAGHLGLCGVGSSGFIGRLL